MPIDFDLTAYNKTMANMRSIANIYPDKSMSFLKKQATVVKKETLTVARSKTKQKTGYYLRSIKSGKSYKYGDRMAVRVFSYAPHAHLIEQPFTMRNRRKSNGKWIFYQARKNTESSYYSSCEKFIDEIMGEL